MPQFHVVLFTHELVAHSCKLFRFTKMGKIWKFDAADAVENDKKKLARFINAFCIN